ncbi:MAG TPA: RES domain-containing protein [Candidatus Elarobacter sp.]
MISVWRLGRRAYCDPPKTVAFDGRGAERFGGRWNPVGIPAAYAASSRALAALEYLVHIDRDLMPNDLVFAKANVVDADVEICVPPRGWDVRGSPTAVLFGERWLTEARSLVLAVPSAVVRGERNYVVNPHHPRAPKLAVAMTLEPFAYDERLFGRSRA